MVFDGHKLFKINRNWAFNLTECVGYKLTWRNNEIERVAVAFKIIIPPNNKDYKIVKYMRIPVGVLNKSKKLVDYHIREALLHEQRQASYYR